MHAPPGSTWRRLVGAAATVSALALTAACSGGSSSSGGAPSTGGPSATDGSSGAPDTLQTTALLGKVEGKLPKAKRSAVRKQVAQAVDAWFDAAYVGGSYPRSDFADSWPGFTSGAQADARQDERVMSNASIGSQISGVEPTARKVTVDVLAVKGHPRGATARFVLKFRTSGDVQRRIEISGRLFLTPGDNGGWRIFGFDVAKGRGA